MCVCGWRRRGSSDASDICYWMAFTERERWDSLECGLKACGTEDVAMKRSTDERLGLMVQTGNLALQCLQINRTDSKIQRQNRNQIRLNLSNNV